jgi:hypothetical protein
MEDMSFMLECLTQGQKLLGLRGKQKGYWKKLPRIRFAKTVIASMCAVAGKPEP